MMKTSFLCKYFIAAVVTQLFSYMRDKGVPFDYICTGEAYVSMYIPDDPTSVFYSVNVSSRDCEADQAYRLERTAVAQVFAFTLQVM